MCQVLNMIYYSLLDAAMKQDLTGSVMKSNNNGTNN